MTKLRKFDEVQISGLHPTNPVTGDPIPAFLQHFMVTRDIDGDVIDQWALYPRPNTTEPIAMSRVCRVNGVTIQ